MVVESGTADIVLGLHPGFRPWRLDVEVDPRPTHSGQDGK